MGREHKDHYKAVVETGSCSTDYRRWEEADDCGHAHRTPEAARKCLESKQVWYCNHGRKQGLACRHCCGYAQGHSTSAHWYNGTVHNQDGERVGA